MKAAIFDEFQRPLEIREVLDPVPVPDAVILDVKANGICRSDWHAWMGHDPSVVLPHIPGHEMSGEIAALGAGITSFRIGDRVTVPFACGCGTCRYCRDGQLHICENDFQPGFTHWGAFAPFVSIRFAEHNLVRIPDTMSHTTAASLGCRFATAYRAIVELGRVVPGSYVAVHGCGGVGLSAIMIAVARQARVIAIDIESKNLDFARSLGAECVVNATDELVPQAVMEFTHGGADVSLDALGHPTTSWNSIHCLRRQGKHVQVGLLLGDDKNPRLPMDIVIARELQILGSHGMSSRSYPRLIRLIENGALAPEKLITSEIPLTSASQSLMAMSQFRSVGITMITHFEV